MERLQEVRKYGRKAKGYMSLVRYLSGERLTRQKSIEAKCYECSGYCADGIRPCTITTCPLWPYSPFRNGEKEGDFLPLSGSGAPERDQFRGDA